MKSDGTVKHRPGHDVTLSASKSVSLMAMVGGDERIVEAHDRAVALTPGWIVKNPVETRMRDPTLGGHGPRPKSDNGRCLLQADTFRNPDPQRKHPLKAVG